MAQSVQSMNGLYRGVVQLEAESDDETHISPNAEYAKQVTELAFLNIALRQPVQHPSGNGSPEHSLGVQRYPQQVHLPPNMNCQNMINQQQDPSVEYCQYHQDSGSFYIPSMISSSVSSPQVLHPPNQNGVYHRSISTPTKQALQNGHMLTRNQRSNTTPSRKMHHSGESRSSIVPSQSNGSSTNLSQHGRSEYSNSSIDDMTGLQHSLRDISQPESIEPRQSSTISKQHSTESDTSDDISFRTVHPSYEDSEFSTTQSNHGRHVVNVAHKENGVNSISANIRPPRRGSNNQTVSTQPYSPTPPGDSKPRERHLTGGSSGSNSEKTPKATVFITYAKEESNPSHIRTVVQIAQTLMKNSIDINVDMLEETMRSMSISEWLEDKITKSDFVLICISPGYKRIVDMEEGSSIDTLNTKYIYRRIHNEYIRNGSKNYRFIPVLLSDGRREHIPHWLCDTKVYNWPKDYSDIIFRLYRIEKYVKPPLGERPRHTIEQYSSISSQPGPSHRHNNLHN